MPIIYYILWYFVDKYKLENAENGCTNSNTAAICIGWLLWYTNQVLVILQPCDVLLCAKDLCFSLIVV